VCSSDLEVKTNFSERNYGCKSGPIRAMEWFFNNVDEGIILEDDVEANESFFFFCEQMLNRYRNTNTIGTVSGNNFTPVTAGNYSYMFSIFPQTWGWATWKRVWKKYDPEIKPWPALRNAKWPEEVLGNKKAANYWKLIFDEVYRRDIDSAWDYQWTFMSWLNKYLTVIPNRNLAVNVGLGDKNATHTIIRSNKFEYPSYPMVLPLKHPAKIFADETLDKYIREHNHELWREVLMYIYRKVSGIK
jgi:hypothetical protein